MRTRIDHVAVRLDQIVHQRPLDQLWSAPQVRRSTARSTAERLRSTGHLGPDEGVSAECLDDLVSRRRSVRQLVSCRRAERNPPDPHPRTQVDAPHGRVEVEDDEPHQIAGTKSPMASQRSLNRRACRRSGRDDCTGSDRSTVMVRQLRDRSAATAQESCRRAPRSDRPPETRSGRVVHALATPRLQRLDGQLLGCDVRPDQRRQMRRQAPHSCR